MSLQYIIDGYNLIKHPLLAAAAKKSSNDRSFLPAYIRQHKLTGSLKNKIIIVFDGFPSEGERPVDEGICVVFSRKISADEKIRKLLEETADRKSLVVVSNDRQVQDSARLMRAKSMTVEEFLGSDKKRSKEKGDDASELKLSFSQMQKVNDELRKLWLK